MKSLIVCLGVVSLAHVMVFGTTVSAESHIEVNLIPPENIQASANGVATALVAMVSPEHYGASLAVDGTLKVSPLLCPANLILVRRCASTLVLVPGGSTTLQCTAGDTGQCSNSWRLETLATLKLGSTSVGFGSASTGCSNVAGGCGVPHRDQ